MILRQLRSNPFALSARTKWLGVTALVFFSFVAAEAQNTKGDKPATGRSIFRIPKLKSKKKGGDKAYTGDVSGRRIRTKNKSSAVRAIQTVPPTAGRKPSGDRPYRVASGNRSRVRSRTAEASRNNVYPKDYTNFFNPHSKPRDNQRPYSNARAVGRAAAMGTKRQPPGRKRIITPRSASRSFVTRGRKNVYWGKFRKGEKPITTDISGRTLRAKNFHTPGLGVIPAGEVYKRKQKRGDQPFKGTFSHGYVTTPKSTRPWRGDLSGHAIRTKSPKVSQEAGKFFERRKLSISNKRRGLSKPLPGSGLARRRPQDRISNQPIPGTLPGYSTYLIGKGIQRTRGRKTFTQGNRSASRGFTNNGQPIARKPPGMGARFVDRFQGFSKGGVKAFNTDGYSFSGNLKGRRPLKGGGSISGRARNNGGSPITVKGPGVGGGFVDIYRGNIKAQRPLKGGGSISGRSRNNGGQPITVKGPGIGGRFVDIYRGNLKAQRPLKGGGSISGRSRNNGGQPITVKGPGIGGRFVDIYQGNLKTHRPLKGGGSISARPRDNGGRPIDVKGPGMGGRFVDVYQGNIKFKRQPKGGGSISGHWNNGGRPIIVKSPTGIQSKNVDRYQGFIKGGIKSFSTAGANYQGDLKGHKPLKGGGSVSGKLWNNHEKPIDGKAYAPESRKITVFRGDTKQSHYIRNPNAKEEALKKIRPSKATNLVGDLQVRIKSEGYKRNPNAKEEALKKIRPGKSTYLVGDLQVKTKARDYARNKLSSKDALKGESNGRNSLRAIEYSGRIKQLWVRTFGNEQDVSGRLLRKPYVRNPHSKKEALMVRAPGKAYARIKDLQVNIKMIKPHGRNFHPDSKYAHSLRDNVKHERTFLMTLKLKWTKLFKRNDTQPASVKQKVRRPRYDPKERDLWKDLYD